MLRIKTLPGKTKEAIDILRSMHDAVCLKQGCIHSDVYQSHREMDQVLYVEYWTKRELFQRHIQSDLYGRVLAVMELSQEAPEIQFHEFSSSEGMELIQTLRRGSEQ